MGHEIPEVHLAENQAASRRDSVAARAYPLGEADRPTNSQGSGVSGSAAIVRYLAVESSARYQRSPKSTYCNIYAYDYCYLAGVYLPRVWWTEPALARIASGEVVPVRYGETVRELNANSLYDWLKKHGAGFGWRAVATEEALQQAVNQGKVGLICAQRTVLSASGHIAVVVPEVPEHLAEREGGVVRLPLQSQAGARNFSHGCGLGKWWAGVQFRAFGFFVNG